MSDFVIRDAAPSEDDSIAVFFHDCFLKTWNHNWQCSAPSLQQPLASSTSTHLTTSQSSRLLFYRALIRAVRLAPSSHIRIIHPSSSPSTILGVAMWTAPNHPIMSNPLDILKTGFYKLLLPNRWGIKGYKRLVMTFEATVEKLSHVPYEERTDWKAKSAYLQMVAVAESARGQGLVGKLIEDGARLYEGCSLMLDGTEDMPRRVYQRSGFVQIAETLVAKGEGDEDGCVAKTSGKEVNKKGFLMYVMVRKGRE